MENYNRFLSKLLRYLATAILLCVGASTYANEILDVRWNEGPNNTRVVIDLSSQAEYKYGILNNPPRVYLDLKNTKLNKKLSLGKVTNRILKNIRHAARGEDGYRIVLDLHEPISPHIFRLKPYPPFGHRLVVDLSAPIELEECSSNTEPHSDVVVVIDPGHGGEDPGALGSNKLMEKTVNLAISFIVRDIIEAQSGFKVVMTRDADYEVPLETRRDIALRERAHLFVSIHADSFTNPKPRGASIFVLGSSAAQRELDNWLAKNQNSPAWTGGVASWVNSRCFEDPELYSFLNNLASDVVLENSVDVGKAVLHQLSLVSRLHPRALNRDSRDFRVTDSRYVVLKSTHVPSLLIETGFLSNPQDAALLANPSHRQRVGQAIANGILKYFCDNPPWHTDLSDGTIECELQTTVAEYAVRAGDTLSEIAHEYGVTVAMLRAANNITGSDIYTGQLLKIPSQMTTN